MDDLKIYCSECGEPLSEIIQHHIDNHNYEPMTVEQVKQKFKIKYDDNIPEKIIDSAINIINKGDNNGNN